MDTDGKFRWGARLREIYANAWRDFTPRAQALLTQPDFDDSWSMEFGLCAVGYLPDTLVAWAILIRQDPWLLGGYYAQEDVDQEYPDLLDVLRAVVLNALSDRMLIDVDTRLPAVGKRIDAILPPIIPPAIDK